MLRLGVIGLRNIGKNHVRQGLKTEGVKMVAGADLDPDRCKVAKEEFNLAWTTTESDELLSSEDIDGVVLALPNHLHAPMSIKALQAGKHVLVEKPICGRSEDVDGMIKARDESSKILMVGHNQRFSPKVFALRDALRKDSFGKIYHAKTYWNRRDLDAAPMQRGTWGFIEEKSGGGPMLDLGIHKLDQLLFLLGFPKPVGVSGFLSKGIGESAFRALGKEYTVEDFASGLIHFEGGLCVHVESSYYHAQKESQTQGTIISGTHGLIDEMEAFSMSDGNLSPMDITPASDAPKGCIEHFYRVIEHGDQLLCTAEEAAMSLTLVEAIYASAKSGQSVRV